MYFKKPEEPRKIGLKTSLFLTVLFMALFLSVHNAEQV